MSSINSLSSLLSSTTNGTAQRSRPDPVEKFKELDSDGNGTIDTVELSALAQEIAKISGSELNAEDSIATYDLDGDGALNQEEMDTMMREMGPPPPPPPPPENENTVNWQAIQSYLANMSDDENTVLSMFSDQPPPPPPEPEEKFNELDTDGSQGLNQAELEAMAADFEEMTGIAIDAEEALATYDLDESGELDQDEMDTMMQALRENNQAQPPPGRDLDELVKQFAAASPDEREALLEELFGGNTTLSDL